MAKTSAERMPEEQEYLLPSGSSESAECRSPSRSLSLGYAWVLSPKDGENESMLFRPSLQGWTLSNSSLRHGASWPSRSCVSSPQSRSEGRLRSWDHSS